MFVGETVTTPYGPGIITELRDNGVVVVSPITWIMDRGQKATFYMNPKDVKPRFYIGQEIVCNFGNGFIENYRESDHIFVVRLHDWRLATNKSPVLFLNYDALTHKAPEVVSKPTAVPDNEISIVAESIARSSKFKTEGGNFFKKGDFEGAIEKYFEALTALKYLSDGLNNAEKAAVLIQTVPLHNNIALCNLLLKNFSQAKIFANNAYKLIDSLEVKKSTSKVWIEMELLGMTAEKMFVELKKKSLYYLGKSEVLSNDFDEGIAHLEKALALYGAKEKGVEELKTLIANSKRAQEKAIKKEKETWKRAFKKNSSETEESVSPSNAAATPSKQEPATVKKSPANNPTKNSTGTVSVQNNNSLYFWLAGIFGVVGITSFFLFRPRFFK